MLTLQNYKKLVGFALQSGGYYILINDVTERGAYYHFMMELKENGETKDFLALMLWRKTHTDSIDGNWYRLEPVHNPHGGHQPLQILFSEMELMRIFGELVCIYGRQVWDV